MNLFRVLQVSVVFIPLLLPGICNSQTDSCRADQVNREKLFILPFEVHGLTGEEATSLRAKFIGGLQESGRFEIDLNDSVQKSIEASDPHTLSQVGKSLAVHKVVHAKVVRRGNHFVLDFRLVNVSDATLLYAERVDYVGELDSLLSDIVPGQARKLSKAHLDAPTPWAKATFLFGACLGATLWVLWHFRRGKPKKAPL